MAKFPMYHANNLRIFGLASATTESQLDRRPFLTWRTEALNSFSSPEVMHVLRYATSPLRFFSHLHSQGPYEVTKKQNQISREMAPFRRRALRRYSKKVWYF